MGWKDNAEKLDKAIKDAKTCKQLYMDAQSIVEKLRSECLEALKAESGSIIDQHYATMGTATNGVHVPKKRRRRQPSRRRGPSDRKGRKLSLLKLFGERGGFVTTQDVMNRLGWPSSTSATILGTLVGDGKVSRIGKGRYSLNSVHGKKEVAPKTS